MQTNAVNHAMLRLRLLINASRMSNCAVRGNRSLIYTRSCSAKEDFIFLSPSVGQRHTCGSIELLSLNFPTYIAPEVEVSVTHCAGFIIRSALHGPVTKR